MALVATLLLIALVLGLRQLEVHKSVNIVEGEHRPDGTLVLLVESCNGQPAASVREQTNDKVRIKVVASSTPLRGGDDCLDVVEVTLQEPLHDRVVIDASTGRRVPVR